MLNKGVYFLKLLPSPMAIFAKKVLVYPRYWNCLLKARKSYRELGHKYNQNVLFIAGMPKSGTTWLEKMLSSYPGYKEVLMPEASFAELREGQGHLFELPQSCFERFNEALVLTKMHCHGAEKNVQELDQASIPYVVLYRDPRDVSVSHYHYVMSTPWHGDYKYLKDLPLEEGIRYFINKRLPEFALWMRSWRDNRNDATSLMISYEELLNDTESVLKRILHLFELEASDSEIRTFVEQNSFKRMSEGNLKRSGFFRKGQAGDWVNHYTDSLKQCFKDVEPDLLIEFGYEQDRSW